MTRQTVRSLLCAVRLLPDRRALEFGAALGSLFYRLLPRYALVARANLRRVYGAVWSEAEIEAMVQRNFRHHGRTLIEFLKMSHWSKSEIEGRVELRGTEWLDAALCLGQGAIIVTAHYGNWELLGARLVVAGYRLSVIARDADDPETNALINSIRERCGCGVLSRRSAMRPALACLRRNELLGILLDQNALVGGIFVDFFGHPAATATGPAALARRTGAALVPVFDRRHEDGRHTTRFLPPVTWNLTDDKDRDIREITARLTQVIETQIRSEPEQWFWIHNRWKQTPRELLIADC